MFWEPVDGKYRYYKKVRRGEMLALPGELGGAIAVDEMLGEYGLRLYLTPFYRPSAIKDTISVEQVLGCYRYNR